MMTLRTPRPEVSVMVPCFNAAESLPMAISSILAQSFEDFEAIFVDDGSTDTTWEMLHVVEDPRLVRIRFDENRGRGAARQAILERVRGKYLSMLDADDWLFPHKLRTQVAIMNGNPSVSVHSAASAITKDDGTLVGAHFPTEKEGVVVERMQRFGPPPTPFPQAMIRMEHAKSARFDLAMRRSQDSDFLLQFLPGKTYALSRDVIYAYSQASAANLSKTLEGYRYRARCYRKHLKAYPVQASRHIALTGLKYLSYQAAGALGQERRLIEKRWSSDTFSVEAPFHAAQEKVEQARSKFFGGTDAFGERGATPLPQHASTAAPKHA